VISQTVYCCR